MVNEYKLMVDMSRKLRRVMFEKGINTEDVRKAAGVNAGTVSCWLNAKHMMRASTLLAVCQTLDISADWLLGLTDEPRRIT